MEIVERPVIELRPAAVDMTLWHTIVKLVEQALSRPSEGLPCLVWPGDEVDVTVTLSQGDLNPGESEHLRSEPYREIERIFDEMGIEFDTGMGSEGRDWEWDYSLVGPISVRFKGAVQCPENRLGVLRTVAGARRPEAGSDEAECQPGEAP